ncbi:hypothetical protein J1614_003717 [Plenodomus biglobosus]|nr:hypothetical protein J1614_003717 [Plenodomus biglobosus]
MWSFLKLTTSLIGFGAALFGANSLPHKSGLALRDAGLYIKSATPSILLPTISWPPVDVIGVYNQCMRLPEDDAGELFAKMILCEMLRPYAEESMVQTAVAHVATERLNTNADIATVLECEPIVVIVAVPKPTLCFDLPGTPTRPPTFTIKMLFVRVADRAMGPLRRFSKPVIWCANMAFTSASKTWYVWNPDSVIVHVI